MAPTGRWGRPRLGPELPVHDDVLLAEDPAPARRGRIGDPAGRWVPLPEIVDRSRTLGRWVTFAFGQARTGFLELTFLAPNQVDGLIFAGMSLPDPRLDEPDHRLVKVAGLGSWIAFEPETFRYVTVLALEEVAAARLFSVDPTAAAPLMVERAAPAGRAAPGGFRPASRSRRCIRNRAAESTIGG